MSIKNEEAELQNDQSSEPKSKLPKRNFQQSWLEEVKMAEVWIHQRVCSVHFAKSQISDQSQMNKLILLFI